ncbi:hypothetical protein GOBAR_AA27814 [Gossypium barbadense]|uniref:Peptidase A1 domain-containing protein n=1 Tax=Gossypium barbadense TaxID=3634 RepID=A0A2P5WP57_GOSBA|nr:hypothetical protein GOBAR_AA27814 [Gossypium barbadense]
MALIVALPIGTPPQTQQMVLDTGSQLSWIQCHKKLAKKPPPTASFDPSLSSSFSVLPCNHPLCKPRIPDFTLPTSCDQNRLCHYSYFYADGTLAEGNLVREKITFSRSQSTPPLILGCATDSSEDKLQCCLILIVEVGLGTMSEDKVTDEVVCALEKIRNLDGQHGEEGSGTISGVGADVGGGVHCLGIGRSNMLGIASNIIGNFHQQNLWVEFDLANRRLGFGKADCSRAAV